MTVIGKKKEKKKKERFLIVVTAYHIYKFNIQAFAYFPFSYDKFTQRIRYRDNFEHPVSHGGYIENINDDWRQWKQLVLSSLRAWIIIHTISGVAALQSSHRKICVMNDSNELFWWMMAMKYVGTEVVPIYNIVGKQVKMVPKFSDQKWIWSQQPTTAVSSTNWSMIYSGKDVSWRF